MKISSHQIAIGLAVFAILIAVYYYSCGMIEMFAPATDTSSKWCTSKMKEKYEERIRREILLNPLLVHLVHGESFSRPRMINCRSYLLEGLRCIEGDFQIHTDRGAILRFHGRIISNPFRLRVEINGVRTIGTFA